MRSEFCRRFLFSALLAAAAVSAGCNNTLGKLQSDNFAEPYVALRSEPAAGAQIGNLTQIRLWYAEPVCGAARLANYRLEGATGTLQLTAISEEADGSFLLSLTGIAGAGSLYLRIANVKDGSDRPVNPEGLAWVSAPTGPQVLSALPAQNAAVPSLVDAKICWDRAATGAGLLSSYILTGPVSGATAATIQPATGNCYTLGFSGTTAAGLYTLSFSGISDGAGNTTQAGPLRWTVDSSPPYVLTTDPVTGSDISAVNKIDMVFSETVTGADNKDNYAFSGPGAGSLYVQTVNPLPGSYRLHVKGTAASGAISLVVSNVADSAGNALNPSALSFTAP